jgi:senataxin
MAILLRRGIKGLVAIGDPQQLPSVISNQDLRIKGFACSMFERLIRAGSPHTMLDVQYRMDPSISKWPSQAFYDNNIIDGPNVQVQDRRPAWQKGQDLAATPYTFVNIPGTETHIPATRSYSNTAEANIIVGFVKVLLARLKDIGHAGRIEVGCITGYAEQVELLSRKIASISSDAKFWQTTSRIHRIELQVGAGCTVIFDIASVDAFQGQERDIVLFATTRSNPERNMGFLSELIFLRSGQTASPLHDNRSFVAR